MDAILCQKEAPDVSRMKHAFTFTFAALLGLMTTRTRADLIVSPGQATVAAGDTGMIDITVTSNSSDTLSNFGLELLITPLGTATQSLAFTSSQADPYSNSNYVFYSASTNSDLGIPFWSALTTTTYLNDTIGGGDSYDSSGGIPVASSTTAPYSYLATVQFSAQAGTMGGDQYQISLVNDSDFTYFNDANGNPLAYTSSAGLVTIGSASGTPMVVPELPTLPVASVTSLIGLLWYRCRRRRGSLMNSP
jgi:hypothetical protein